MKDLVYPELSYKVVGVLFEVSNQLGTGHKEKYYEHAVARALGEAGLNYEQQVRASLSYNGETIGEYIFDFLVEKKIVLELKQGNFFSKKNIDQVYAYLRSRSLKLGIIAQFTKDGVKYRRVLNIR